MKPLLNSMLLALDKRRSQIKFPFKLYWSSSIHGSLIADILNPHEGFPELPNNNNGSAVAQLQGIPTSVLLSHMITSIAG